MTKIHECPLCKGSSFTHIGDVGGCGSTSIGGTWYVGTNLYECDHCHIVIADTPSRTSKPRKRKDKIAEEFANEITEDIENILRIRQDIARQEIARQEIADA